MVLLRRVVVFERPYLHKELVAAAALYLRYALHRFARIVVCVIYAGLVLTAHVVALPVPYRGVYHVEVRQQQRVQTYPLGVVFHPHGLPKAGAAPAYRAVVGVRRARAVGVAALRVYHAGYGLHQLFHAPKAAARQIYHVFRGVHIHALLAGRIGGPRGRA